MLNNPKIVIAGLSSNELSAGALNQLKIADAGNTVKVLPEQSEAARLERAARHKANNVVVGVAHSDTSGTGQFAYLRNLGFAKCESVYALQDAESVPEVQFSLRRLNGMLVKMDCDEIVANFTLIPKRVISIQKVVDGEFETDAIVFQLNFDGKRAELEVPFDTLDKIDQVVSRRYPRLVVVDRSLFIDYVNELRIFYAKDLDTKRLSTVEGFVKGDGGYYYHSSMSDIHVTNRQYPSKEECSKHFSEIVSAGIDFLDVGGDEAAINKIFLMAHLGYAFQFLAGAGYRPQFAVLLDAPSGSGKTGLCRELFNLFAAKDEQIVNINSSTAKGIEKFLKQTYRHETAVIDDIVVSSAETIDKSRATFELITRLVGDQGVTVKSLGVEKMHQSVLPEIACVITAETGFTSSAESSNARNVRIQFRRGEIEIKKLAGFTANPEVMRKYFYCFILFLVQNQKQLISYLSAERQAIWSMAYSLLKAGTHERIVGNLRSIIALAEIVRQFHMAAGIESEQLNRRWNLCVQSFADSLENNAVQSNELNLKERFVEFLHFQLKQDYLVVVEVEDMKEMLVQNQYLEFGKYLVRWEGNGKTLYFADPDAVYENFKNWLLNEGHMMRVKKLDFFKDLLNNKIIHYGDKKTDTKRRVPNCLRNFGLDRWLAINSEIMEVR